jgi:hypothetical protein
VRWVAPAQLEREAVAEADLLVLDHPGKLMPEGVRLVATRLRRGAGVLYIAAEADDAVNLRALADSAGSDWQMPVDFIPPPSGQKRRGLFIAELRRQEQPFIVFGEALDSLTAPLRFGGGLASRRIENTLADEILATYSDRSACLVATSCGSGTIAVLNADLMASNLAASPAFVPLVGELVDRLLARHRSVDAVACGEPLVVPLPAQVGPATGLTLTGPKGSDPGQLQEESGGVIWRSIGLSLPGVYEVKRGDATVFAVAAATPAEESDLRPLEPAVLAERLTGGRKAHFRSAADRDDEGDRLWTWLAAGCVVCLLGEWLALKLFRT